MEKLFNHLVNNDSSQSRETRPEDRETLLPNSNAFSRYEKHSRTTPSWIKALIITISLLAATAFGAWFGRQWPINLDSTCTRHVSRYSPVIKNVDISYNTIRFNGSLLKENVFRQDAGPVVDAAWQSLGVDYRSILVPADEAEASGLRQDQVKINQKYGGGFPANVEGLHQLHCLNLLRQSLYYNYDHYHATGKGAFSNSDDIVRYHVSHCLDIIRQQLMCTIDLGVLGQVWWNPSAPQAYVDFNTRHTCRNFDAVRQWAEDHQAPAQVPGDFLEPPKEGDRIFETIP